MARRFPYLGRVTSQKETHSPDNGHIEPHYDSEFPPDSAIRIVSVDENGLMEMLLKLRDSERFIADLAPKLGVSAQHLGNVLAGRATFGPKLLRGLGVVRTYQMFDVEVVMDKGKSE
jgi:hypothetical protein